MFLIVIDPREIRVLDVAGQPLPLWSYRKGTRILGGILAQLLVRY